MRIQKISRTLISVLLTVMMVISTAMTGVSAAVLREDAKVDNTVTAEGTTSFGDLVTTGLDASQKEQSGGNLISSVEVKGKVATASFTVSEDALLLVSVYTEDEKTMLASGKVEVTADMTKAEVEIETSSMPQYFYLKAFLVEKGTFAPLCTAYSSPNYTKEMQEFFRKTTSDFPADRVLNLDSDKTNNFAVYSEDVKRFDVTDTQRKSVKITTASDGSKVYTIPNAPEAFRSFRKGDKVAYDYDSPDGYIFKVDTITFSGTTATIKTTDLKLDEAFEIVKIETEINGHNATTDDSYCADGITPAKDTLASVGYEGEYSPSASKSFDLKYEVSDKYSITGSLTMEVKGTFKVYVSWTYRYYELSADISATFGIKVTGTVKAEFPLSKFDAVPLKGVDIGIFPALIVEASASISFETTAEFTVGVKNVGNGAENISTLPKAKPIVKAEGEFFFGVKAEIKAEVIEEKLGGSLEAKAGITVTSSEDWLRLPSSSAKHQCLMCLGGEIGAKLSLTASCDAFEIEELTFEETWSYKDKIKDFYWSTSFNEFEYTTCPHIAYAVTVTVKDKEGKVVSGASVTSEKALKESITTTDSRGEAKLFLPGGEHSVKVTKSEYKDAITTVYVNGKPASKQVTLERLAEAVTVTVKDKEGNLLSGASVTSDKATANSITTTDSKGVATLYLPDGEHSIKVTKSEYKDVTTKVSVNGKPAAMQVTLEKLVLPEISMIAAGYGASAVLVNNGDLYMWGENWQGELGDGTSTTRKSPVKIMSDVKYVSVGNDHSGAVTKNGDLYMWGYNVYGQIGDGTTTTRKKPVKIMSDVKSVCLGYDYSAAITENGDLYMWGDNMYGKLGDGTTTTRKTPVKIMSGVRSVSLGFNHTAAVKTNGDLYVWGYNGCGQVGDGTSTTRKSPVKIMSKVKSVSVTSYEYGDTNTAAVTDDGSLYTWGAGASGSIGNGQGKTQLKPYKISSNMKYVDMGNVAGGAIDSNGILYTWGSSWKSQTGTGKSSGVPGKIMSDVKLLSMGMSHSLAVTKDGTLYAWGENGTYQLGDGTKKTRSTPVRINTSSMLSSAKSVASVGAQQEESNKASVAQVGASVSVSGGTKFTGLNAGSVYNFYSVRSLDADDLLSAKNLVYVDQFVADNKGEFTVTYAAAGSGVVEFVVSAEGIDGYLFGDVNLDGNVNVKDATAIQKYLALMITFDATQKRIADFDGDGKVTIKDTTAIQKKVAGLI